MFGVVYRRRTLYHLATNVVSSRLMNWAFRFCLIRIYERTTGIALIHSETILNQDYLLN